MSDNPNILEAHGLHKTFGRGPAKVHVLRGLSLAIRRGEFLAIMGPSGCGKSTLLHVLGLMAEPQAGSVLLNGREVAHLGEQERAKLRKRMGFVFQRFNLISVLSGYDNIALSLKVRGLPYTSGVEELLTAMGVAEVARRRPPQMSIGEQQRVTVVRALAGGCDLLFADEPTGSLDSDSAEELLALLKQTNQWQGQTIVMITHSAQAATAADRILYMKDGRITDDAR